jgi:hypothetical protein
MKLDHLYVVSLTGRKKTGLDRSILEFLRSMTDMKASGYVLMFLVELGINFVFEAVMGLGF